MIPRLLSQVHNKYLLLKSKDTAQSFHKCLYSSHNESGHSPEAIASTVHVFDQDALSASQSLANALSPAQRSVLLAALSKKVDPEMINDAYIEELFKLSSNADGHVTERCFKSILLAHTSAPGVMNSQRPDLSTLRMLFLASAIPFIGFGFLDNFIMLTVGEEIDSVFGTRLGLTTMASAGLGNLVADAVGVGAANGIERGVKKLHFVKPLELSRSQEGMSIVKATKLSGSLIGVVIGCLLGLSPLVISGHFFTQP
ncbi:hypothetical protein CEUSTIGMA_g9633.t1 [Chlamydomonas eustigma]|uniref:EF-hand domain-containing protein n=1 Tax=Chlamydomonas eustigma TaxID=1157962 RepID=A0A250XGJ9_9CHLO|nr:hypothetical protein CEUSTIGMA_g9633.t1 [Chlamydomonas eustigma]|eukprot:GAX82205.1 hypothetical protein CEUSTIGMA_g9633.t1 [Chlamydomonas eustigma]